MKKAAADIKKFVLKIRVNKTELDTVQKNRQKTTEKTLSNYIRKVATQQPVFITYRNQTADDFLKDMVALKNELNHIGNNFNQAVHKLHILNDIPDFRRWIQDHDNLYHLLMNQVERINNKVAQLYEQWLLK